MESQDKTKKGFKLLIPFRFVAITAYAILIIPIIIFFIGWLRWYFSVPFSAILLFGLFWVIKKDYWKNKDCVEVPFGVFIGTSVIFLLWILLSGNCFTSAGSYDTIWRTTTLRDLVNYKWPVYYPEADGYLCYYFVFWMVPALFGKIGGMPFAYAGLLLWFFLILITTFLLLAYLFKDYKKSTLKLIVAFMILWSGINILGKFIMYNLGLSATEVTFGLNESYCDDMWLGNEPFNYYYRSNFDFFSECYNQLPIWLVMPLMLQNRNVRNYAFLGLLLFPYSPWSIISLAGLMVADALCMFIKSIKEKKVKKFFGEVFSVQNICAIVSLFVVFGTYYTIDSQAKGADDGFRLASISKMTPQIWEGTVVFWLCEFGIYYLLTWKKYKKDVLYKVMLFMLIIIPLCRMGPSYSRDFCLDVSLPLLYLLMIYVIDYVRKEICCKERSVYERYKLSNCILIVALGLSFITPISGFVEKIKIMNVQDKISVQDNSVTTFADLLGYQGGFSATIAKDADDAFFFKHMAKKVDKSKAKRLPISEEFSDIRKIEDIDEYLDYLEDKDCTVYVAVKDVQGYSLTDETVDKLKALGFDEHIDSLLEKRYQSFIGIVKNGEKITQKIGGDKHIYYDSQKPINGKNVHMESATWNKDNYCVIDIDKGHYAVNSRGLNIVVYDNKAGRVIDSVAFDTHDEKMTCTRKAQ